MAKKTANKTLTPALIAECGLHVAAGAGVDAVSIRKIADELGVTPMAIYRHFRDKDELLAVMLDRFIEQADVLPVQVLPWQQWLQHVGMAMYQALCQAPSWIALFGRLQLKPGALAVMESYLLVMNGAGFNREQAARGFFGLLQSLIGAATMHSAFSNITAAETALAELDAGEYPQVAASLVDIAGAAASNLMHNGLQLLVDGLAVELQQTKR